LKGKFFKEFLKYNVSIRYLYLLLLLSFISFKSVLKQFETNQTKLIIEKSSIVIVSGGATPERFALVEIPLPWLPPWQPKVVILKLYMRIF